MGMKEWPVVAGQWSDKARSADLPAAGHRPSRFASRRGLTTLVIGLGNPLRGDDGIGPAVIGVLRSSATDEVTLVESAGDNLLGWLASEGFGRIILVDAADLGRPAGEWLQLTPDDLGSSKNAGLAHGFGLTETLGLLLALGVQPPPIVIYAVQPAAVGWGPGLSREARRGATAVAAAIRHELCHPQPPRRGGTVLRAEKDVRSLPCGGETA
jgi:hydrogenase maturation protease